MGVARVPNNDSSRLSRVLDAKTRTIGVDRGALDQLVAFKAKRAAEETARDRQFALRAQHAAEAAEAAQAAVGAAWREAERRVAAFRTAEQAAASRREWDLQRPDALRRDCPARVGDDDPRAGPASLQRFAGEDLQAAQRRAAAGAADQRDWRAQQADRLAHEAAERAESVSAAAWARQQERAQLAAMTADEEAHRAVESRVAAANASAHAAAVAVRSAEHCVMAAAEAAELAAAAASAMLTEDPSSSRNACDPHRVRRDHWKGMSPEQRTAYPLWQLQQMELKVQQLQTEEAADRELARRQQDAKRAIDQQVHLLEARKLEEDHRTAQLLQRQAAEKAARDAALHKLYDDNSASPEYFGQFQTSHR